MEFFTDLINYPHLTRAAITAMVIGIVSGVVGCLIILRGLSLMGDAISHAVMPGIAVSFFFGANIFVGALISGLLAAAGIGFVNANTRLKRDTSIGIVFTAFLAAGVILLARTESSVSLQSILFGDVLATRTTDMWQSIVIAVVITILVVLFYKQLQITTMDAEIAKAYGFPTRAINYAVLIALAVVTVSAVQTVGVILVVAMLVTPAATAFLLSKKFSTMMWLAALFGMFSSIAGLYFSYTFQLQSGPAIVLVAFSLFVLAFFFSPSQGFIWTQAHKRRERRLIAIHPDSKEQTTL
ncbi:metal ABC transporter permease [Enteractinococcus fodinae]|uniref:Iron/zinc/copper transport system permease protein n=1 Tax=Enteractinococcus fodinae TaxID=684663 RepID=A0ABU2AZQ2_9MICC|nr:metal ABC transporter permease [Enteractinococcus fodinae]MDR7346838.1 iron/zinc/copper transport system permease protein [Enteractinococcus fodinae]